MRSEAGRELVRASKRIIYKYILKLKTQTTTPDHFRVARGCKKLVECRVVLHAGTVQNALHTHIHCVVVLFTSH